MTVTIIYKPKGNPYAAAATPDASAVLPSACATKTTSNVPAVCNDLLPDLKVEMVPLNTLVSARHPVRKLSSQQVSRASQSIRRFGFRDPPILGKGVEIIDGHARIEAAHRLGLKEIPCIIADDLSDTDVRLLRIALNRIGERGEWDEQALKIEFAYLLEFEPDLSVTGFDHPEIDRILVLDDLGLEEPDPLDNVGQLPDPDGSAVSRLGDIWRLGCHRVVCGNARSSEDIGIAVGDRKVSAVFADHPFNVSVDRHIRVGGGKFPEFAEASGEMSPADYEEFLRITTGNMMGAIKPGGILFLCIDWRHVEVLMRVVRTLGLDLLNMCVWVKENGGMGSLYRSQHEFVLVVRRPGAPHLNNVQLGIHGRNRTNVWSYAGATGGRKSAEDDFSLHPTVKPVRLVRDAILDVTAMGDVILDPFLGSGTTIIAAELSNRICVGLEISPAYVDVVIGRWEQLTGLEAIHDVTGQTFAALRDARKAAQSKGRGAAPDASRPVASSDENF